jgi:dipeptidase D
MPVEGVAYNIALTGLYGGHSGAEIDKNRVNSVYAMTRLLFEVRERVGYSLLDFYGGLKDNAIPRECTAVIATDSASLTIAEASLILGRISDEICTEKSPDKEFSFV